MKFLWRTTSTVLSACQWMARAVSNRLAAGEFYCSVRAMGANHRHALELQRIAQSIALLDRAQSLERQARMQAKAAQIRVPTTQWVQGGAKGSA